MVPQYPIYWTIEENTFQRATSAAMVRHFALGATKIMTEVRFVFIGCLFTYLFYLSVRWGLSK